MPKRWDGDERGYGVGDATQLLPGATELIAAFRQRAWVAERPEIHLRPHVEAWCQHDQRLGLTEAYADDTDAYILHVKWRGEPGSLAEARAAVFALIGSFAESATYVHQHRLTPEPNSSRRTLRFEVGTGELAPDSRFAPHGHVVVIDVAGVL
jgi:hypothetical protein